MSDHPRPSRLARLLARGYPRALRDRYADDIARFIDDSRRDPAQGGRRFRGLRVGIRLLWDALAALVASWRPGAPAPVRRGPQVRSLFAQIRSFRVDALWQDIRFALRGFIRRPLFTAVAVGSLMLGIGANTAIFTLVNSVLLRPLPYPHAEQLVTIWGTAPGQPRSMLSVLDVEDLRQRNHTFSDIGIVRTISVNLTGGDQPDRLVGSFVTASTLDLLGAPTTIGRLLAAGETAIGAGEPVVVMSYPTWQNRYGGDPNVLGRTLILNGRPHVVIGVTSAEYRDPFDAEVWLPVTSAPNRAWFDRANSTVWAVGRLKPGMTPLDGQRDLAAIVAQLEPEHPVGGRATIGVFDLREELVGGSRFTLALLLGAVVAVLLIVCANLANLQLVRASTREREMSVRAAVGASRGRLAQQVIAESLVLSVAGGALGVLLGNAAVKLLVGMIRLPTTNPVQLDGWVLGFTLIVAMVTGVLFGIPAALFGARVNLQDALRARSEPGSSGRFSARNVLVVAELSLCIALLAVAGLFTRSLLALHRVDPGFEGRNVLTAEFRLPSVKYDDSAKVRGFMSAALERLRAVPGVTAAALIDGVPLSGNIGTAGYVAQGQAEPPVGAAPITQIGAASEDYFHTMGIAVMAGRDFELADRSAAEGVAIVNTVLADRAWPGEAAVGKTIRLLGPPDQVVRVVGVVRPVTQFTLSESRAPQLYLNKFQAGGIFTSIALRTVGEPEALGNALRAAIWSVDRDQPVWKVRSMRFLVDRDLSPAMSSVTLVGAFAVLALVLGIIGVYGVMSFTVAQRTREMVIRMALGASGAEVLRLVLWSGLGVVLIATIIGVAGALVAGQFLEAQLYGVSGSDAATMVGVPALLAVVALAACWLPARRAARVDPAVALRNE